ncbi:MAG: hypothetical protein WCX65_04490 [bacterium]
MFGRLAAAAPFALLVSAFFPVAVFAAKTPDKIKNMSIMEKIKLASPLSGSSEEILAMLTGIGLLFCFLIIFFLFFRRWNIPRMGYFFVTLLILITRFREPADLFWKTGAVTAGLFSLAMFVNAHLKHDFDSRKEPLYFLFNAFTLLIIAFSTEPFTICIAGVSLLASLFFLITLKPVRRGKFTQLDADAKIMETLEKKARRPL